MHPQLPLYMPSTPHTSPFYHQLAFLTPGKSPSKAANLNGYYITGTTKSVNHPLRSTCHPPQQSLCGKRTLAILKSLNTPLAFPPSIHLFRICVLRV